MTVLKRTRWYIVSLMLFLSACSPTQRAYQQNISLYFASNQDVVLSNDDVYNSPADLIYVKRGDRPIATMALAFIEDGRYKWLSRDNAMLVTENGRLVRTVGFKHDLLYSSDSNADPLKNIVNSDVEKRSWNRRIDTEHGDFGAELSSQWETRENTFIVIQNIQFAVVVVEESVIYKSSIYNTQKWTNTFYFHSSSNQLLKSSQRIAPNMDRLELTYVSRALRLAKSPITESEYVN